MTIRNLSDHSAHQAAEVGVWFCPDCKSFHVKAGEVLLTFTKAEFGSFSSAVFDCYSSAVTIEDVREANSVWSEGFAHEASGLTH